MAPWAPTPRLRWCSRKVCVRERRADGGTIALFDREFVKTGLLPKEQSRSLHLAFDQRQMHDYGESITLDRDSVESMVAESRKFVGIVESYLRAHDYLTDGEG